MSEPRIFSSTQDFMSHPAIDDIFEQSLELLPAYEDLDILQPLPRAPRIRKRYCALACFSCLLCCIPNCLWSCATSSCRRQQQHFPDDPRILESKESSWSFCCIGYRSQKRLYKQEVDLISGLAVGGKVRPRGQLHARPAQNYGSETNIRPVSVVPQRAQHYVRVYRLEEKTEETITTCAEHVGPEIFLDVFGKE